MRNSQTATKMVYGRWPAHPNHPTNAPYTLYHAAGSTTVPMNQQTNGGQWNLLGTFTFGPNEDHRIELTDQANGVVIADAVAVAPVEAPPNTAVCGKKLVGRN